MVNTFLEIKKKKSKIYEIIKMELANHYSSYVRNTEKEI